MNKHSASRSSPRLAIVGYGRIALKHIEVFRALECPIVGLCDVAEDRRRLAESGSGIERTYGTVAEMVDRERPDGIVCCVSFDQNFSAAKDVLGCRIPLLLEKPPGLSVTQCRELIQLSRESRTPILPGFNRRHYSILRQVLAEIGGFPGVTSVAVEWAEHPQKLLQRFDPGQVSRMLFGNSIHGLDLLCYLSGRIPEPAILGRSLGDEFRWQMALQGESERGVLAAFTSTWDSPGGWRLVLCSQGRKYTFSPLESCAVQESWGSPSRKIEPDEPDRRFKPGFHGQAAMFLDVLRSGAVPEGFGLETALPAMDLAGRLTEACLGRPVSS